MNTLQSKWESYEREAPKMSEDERRKTRRAFYAGARAFFVLLSRDMSDMSEDAGVAMVEAWREELETFLNQVEQGTA